MVEGCGAYVAGMSAKNYNSFPEAPEVRQTERERERQTERARCCDFPCMLLVCCILSCGFSTQSSLNSAVLRTPYEYRQGVTTESSRMGRRPIRTFGGFVRRFPLSLSFLLDHIFFRIYLGCIECARSLCMIDIMYLVTNPRCWSRAGLDVLCVDAACVLAHPSPPPSFPLVPIVPPPSPPSAPLAYFGLCLLIPDRCSLTLRGSCTW